MHGKFDTLFSIAPSYYIIFWWAKIFHFLKEIFKSISPFLSLFFLEGGMSIFSKKFIFKKNIEVIFWWGNVFSFTQVFFLKVHFGKP